MTVRRHADSGQASLELVGLLPLMVFVAGVVVQIGIAGYCLRSTESAARAGSRAASLCRDGALAARSNPPTWLRDDVQATVARSGDGVRVQVRTQIPVLFTGFSLPNPVVRSATYPQTETC